MDKERIKNLFRYNIQHIKGGYIMRTITKKENIYKFDELDETIQNKIIVEYIDFILNTTDMQKLNKNTNLYKAIKECEKMQTPWFIHQFVFDYCKKQILKVVKSYEYLANGKMY